MCLLLAGEEEREQGEWRSAEGAWPRSGAGRRWRKPEGEMRQGNSTIQSWFSIKVIGIYFWEKVETEFEATHHWQLALLWACSMLLIRVVVLKEIPCVGTIRQAFTESLLCGRQKARARARARRSHSYR